MMLLVAKDSCSRYLIGCPDDCEIEKDPDGSCYLIVPDPDDYTPYWLFDEILIEAARTESFGLRLLFEQPL